MASVSFELGSDLCRIGQTCTVCINCKSFIVLTQCCHIAGNQAFGQGPFAQERPAHAAPAGSSSRSSSPPIADPSQAANSQGSAGNLNAAAPTTAAAQPESLPTQHSSLTNTPSAAAVPVSTSIDASGSLLTFGSFSLPFGPPVGFSVSHPQGLSSGHLAAAPDTAKSARRLAPASVHGSSLPETAMDAGNVPGRFQLASDPVKRPASGQLDAALESGSSHMSGAAAQERVGWDSSREATAATAAPSSGEAPSPFTQPQAPTESAAVSPLHARTDSAASTSSPGLSTHDSECLLPLLACLLLTNLRLLVLLACLLMTMSIPPRRCTPGHASHCSIAN